MDGMFTPGAISTVGTVPDIVDTRSKGNIMIKNKSIVLISKLDLFPASLARHHYCNKGSLMMIEFNKKTKNKPIYATAYFLLYGAMQTVCLS